MVGWIRPRWGGVWPKKLNSTEKVRRGGDTSGGEKSRAGGGARALANAFSSPSLLSERGRSDSNDVTIDARRCGDRQGDRVRLYYVRLRVVDKQPSFKVVDGRLPRGTKLFNFAGSSGLINGVPTTAGSFTFTVQVKDETRATDTETFTVEISRPTRRRSPQRRSPAERSATSTAVAICSPAVGSNPTPGRWSPGPFLPAWSCRMGTTPSPGRPQRSARSPSLSASLTIWARSARRSCP